MTIAEFDALLEQLRPVANLKVMDLLEEAGVDVAPWAIKQDGSPVANPRANPNYCYEWAFGKDHEPNVLCVWHESLKEHALGIAYPGNLKSRAKALEDIALDQREKSDVRSRATSQARRCDEFDRRVQLAWRRSLPLRVILLEGERSDRLGHDASKVKVRLLDHEQWYVESYDDPSGRFTLVRGQRPENRYVDQFSVERPERRERTYDIAIRSQAVRKAVLLRAKGCCELCGRQGFLMASGQVYLETHHVVPLSENGPDVDANVVALCPEDHRKAHFAAEADDIRRKLLARLESFSTEG